MRISNWRNPEFRRNLIVLGSWKDREIRRNLSLAVIGVFAAALSLLFFAGIPLTTSSILCGQMCHATNPQYASWIVSSHSKVPCRSCHEEYAYSKSFEAITRLNKMRTNRFFKPINASSRYSQEGVENESCQACHSPQLQAVSAKSTMGIAGEMHTLHLDANLRCTTCHNRIAHAGAGDYEPLATWQPGFRYKDFMKMKAGCWRCHSKDVAYQDPQVLAIVGSKAPSASCDSCHNKKWTSKPVSGSMNHNAVKGVPWKDGRRRHGKVGLRDFGPCLECHPKRSRTNKKDIEISNCTTSCHLGITIPHNTPTWAASYASESNEPPWLKTHAYVADNSGIGAGKDGRVDDEIGTCSICHNRGNESANFCEHCHHREFDDDHPKLTTAPWLGIHRAVVEKVGSADCQRCHSFEFCVYCHSNREKPPRGMFKGNIKQKT